MRQYYTCTKTGMWPFCLPHMAENCCEVIIHNTIRYDTPGRWLDKHRSIWLPIFSFNSCRH